MSTPTDDTRFDVRVIDHIMRRGKLTQQELDAHLADLPDDAEEGEESVVPFTTPFANRLAREASENNG